MATSSATSISLPSGLWLEGTCHREAEMRPLTGADELFLLETCKTLLPAHRATAMLSRSLTRLGSLDQVTIETIRLLCVGDREALLLHLRRLTLGDRIQSVLSCPNPDCSEKMDLELNVSDLLLPPYSHTQESYETSIEENGHSYRVCFRLPNGASQERAAILARNDLRAAADLLLRLSVKLVTTEDGLPVDYLPQAAPEQLSARMQELDPQAELILNVECPSCGQAFSTLFDTSMYFFQELLGHVKHLYREVHSLAFHYHWSEAEIMGMTSKKRRLYIDLLTDALSEGRG